MLNSNIIQNNVASLYAATDDVDKLKKESSRNQEAKQRKIDDIVNTQKSSVTATDQDSNPQKILDEEENNDRKHNKEQKKQKKDNREVFKDTNKGTIVDITC